MVQAPQPCSADRVHSHEYVVYSTSIIHDIHLTKVTRNARVYLQGWGFLIPTKLERMDQKIVREVDHTREI
jgi:hypothetical protein